MVECWVIWFRLLGCIVESVELHDGSVGLHGVEC